jgi:acyl-[acyl-carrier-protein]-phospholipid O-acyltransferase/long-chain-fatty-acid--[acyl-carrier-protein] ligase
VPGIADGGRLFVRGPNVMLGYLRAEKPGVIELPDNGWYDTGDIVAVDADGFLRIKGRAKRFAKIGGEMVSLAAVEALASELWPDWLAAVSAVPDERKGERLILVTDNPRASRGDLVARARASGMSELMVPSEVMVVERVPVLGSGKVDNVAVAKLVTQRLGGQAGNQAEPMHGAARIEAASPS